MLPVIFLLVAVATAVTGCDFFRKLAGRPTSADLKVMAAAIEAEEAKKVAPADTIVVETLGAAMADTVAAAPAPAPVSASGAVAAEHQGKKRFYIVLASFSNPGNAGKYARQMEQRGYQAELFGFKGGYTGVGICGTDDEQQAKESLKEVRRQDFCPEGVWILDRNKR